MKKLKQAIIYAMQGMQWFFTTQRNGKIQTVALVLVLTLSFVLHIKNIEWCIVLLCSTVVLSLEMINSAIETFCNEYTNDIKPQIKIIKDVSAAAVLLAAVASSIIACFIYIPYLLPYFKK